MAETSGGFVWYELVTSDMDAALAFYREVVGWGGQDSGQDGVRYTLLTAGGTPVAGLMTLPEEVRAAGGRPGWIGYVGVAEVDAAAREVADAGGRVHRAPADIPGIGRFAVVADPQGAPFVLFTPLAMPPQASAAPGTPGHVGWHELHTPDPEAAFGFYAGRFGWTKGDALDLGPMGAYQLFATGGEPAGGMMGNAGLPRPAWLYYLTVPGIDGAAARIVERGGQILNGPQQVPGGSWVVQATDPQGAMFALVAPGR